MLDLVFWPRSVDRAVDRAYYRPGRSTGQSTDPLAIGVCTLYIISVDRSPIVVDRVVD